MDDSPRGARQSPREERRFRWMWVVLGGGVAAALLIGLAAVAAALAVGLPFMSDTARSSSSATAVPVAAATNVATPERPATAVAVVSPTTTPPEPTRMLPGSIPGEGVVDPRIDLIFRSHALVRTRYAGLQAFGEVENVSALTIDTGQCVALIRPYDEVGELIETEGLLATRLFGLTTGPGETAVYFLPMWRENGYGAVVNRIDHYSVDLLCDAELQADLVELETRNLTLKPGEPVSGVVVNHTDHSLYVMACFPLYDADGRLIDFQIASKEEGASLAAGSSQRLSTWMEVPRQAVSARMIALGAVVE